MLVTYPGDYWSDGTDCIGIVVDGREIYAGTIVSDPRGEAKGLAVMLEAVQNAARPNRAEVRVLLDVLVDLEGREMKALRDNLLDLYGWTP